jgi:hypothetical protein
MSCARPWIAWAALLLAPLAFAQESPESTSSPSALISECAETAERNVVGLEALEAECPGLDEALEDAGFSAFLSDAQLEQLTPFGLVDLERLDARYRESIAKAAGTQASVDDLKPILESLQKPTQAEVPLTWFEKFKRWLRNLFEQREQESQSWLERWLKDVKVPQTVTRWLVYGAIGLVIILAIVVIINELRAAGVLRRRAKQAARDLSVSERGENNMAVTDLDALDERERPAALLKLLVATLVKTGRLRAEKSLTHRELSRRAAFDVAEQRDRFEELALLGEMLLYGHSSVPRERIEAVVQGGRALQSELAQSKASA